jgi:hypothetical protein
MTKRIARSPNARRTLCVRTDHRGAPMDVARVHAARCEIARSAETECFSREIRHVFVTPIGRPRRRRAPFEDDAQRAAHNELKR